jgi:hypothetical protein
MDTPLDGVAGEVGESGGLFIGGMGVACAAQTAGIIDDSRSSAVTWVVVAGGWIENSWMGSRPQAGAWGLEWY